MPRLQQYVGRNAHYVLTTINGSVITYQITPEGERKLSDAGVVAGQTFDRALLLELYKTGDAYAPGIEFPEAVRANQLEMDFAGDPNPESAFPVCDGCRSPRDLHLTMSGSAAPFDATLRCPSCRAHANGTTDSSIPLSLLNRSRVTRLFEQKGVAAKSENVRRYETLLDTEFVQRWEALRRQRSTSQSTLFGNDELGGLGLG